MLDLPDRRRAALAIGLRVALLSPARRVGLLAATCDRRHETFERLRGHSERTRRNAPRASSAPPDFHLRLTCRLRAVGDPAGRARLERTMNEDGEIDRLRAIES